MMGCCRYFRNRSSFGEETRQSDGGITKTEFVPVDPQVSQIDPGMALLHAKPV